MQQMCGASHRWHKPAHVTTAVVTLLLSFCLNHGFAEESHPVHLMDAKAFLHQLDLRNTNYEHGEGKVVWSGSVEARTDCSGFIDHLLAHTYGYTPYSFRRWFNKNRPTAARYHDAIVAQKGFVQLQSVRELRPGDLIAIKYPQPNKNTGHIMLVAEAPEKIPARQPFVEGSEQWSVTVIDSAESGHGPTDTRHKKGLRGKDKDGLGQGVFRIYATPEGQILGYSWSLLAVSQFIAPEKNHLVLGRLVANYQP